MLTNNVWDDTAYSEHVLPLLAFVNHAVSYNFRKSVYRDIR